MKDNGECLVDVHGAFLPGITGSMGENAPFAFLCILNKSAVFTGHVGLIPTSCSLVCKKKRCFCKT